MRVSTTGSNAAESSCREADDKSWNPDPRGPAWRL